MSQLIIINTHYQLLVALQLVRTCLNFKNTDLLISNHCKGLKEVGSELKRKNLFRSVYLVENYTELRNAKKYQKLLNVVQLGTGVKSEFHICGLDNQKYDAIYYYNFDYQTMDIVNYFAKKNRKLELNKFEEGLFSYRQPKLFQIGMTTVLIKALRKITGQPDWNDSQKNFYCFFPEYANTLRIGNYTAKKIEKIQKDDLEFKEIIRDIYRYQEITSLKDAKVIYFCSAYDVDELKLLAQLAEKYGKDNILVKPHPRKGAAFLSEQGYHVLDTVYPWEIIQMLEDMSGKKLVSINSGSVLLASAIFEDSCEGALLYPMISGYPKSKENRYIEYINKNIKDVLEYFHKKGMLEKINIWETI